MERGGRGADNPDDLTSAAILFRERPRDTLIFASARRLSFRLLIAGIIIDSFIFFRLILPREVGWRANLDASLEGKRTVFDSSVGPFYLLL